MMDELTISDRAGYNRGQPFNVKIGAGQVIKGFVDPRFPYLHTPVAVGGMEENETTDRQDMTAGRRVFWTCALARRGR